MKKRIRELQPAHKSDRITVAQAARAFRKVQGDTPRPGFFDDDAEEAAFHRGTYSRRVIVADKTTTIAADTKSPDEKSPPPARGR